jgi:hypothetical protein
MDADKSVHANFVQVQATLSISVEGYGDVSASQSGNVFPVGATVTLTATPDDLFEFAGWSGDASGAENPLTVVMDTGQADRGQLQSY